MDEKLEFSLQDLGRLAASLGEIKAVVNWIILHAVTADAAHDAVGKVMDAYVEELLGQPGGRGSIRRA